TGHRGEANSVAWAPDGRTLAAGGFDGAVVFWDVTGRQQKGRLRAADLSADQLTKAIAALNSDNAAEAHRAIWMLSAAPQQAFPRLKEQLKPAASTDSKRINELIGQLDDDDFTVRQQATTELEKLGAGAGPALRKAVESTWSAEVRLRAQRLLERLDTPETSAAWARTGRALEVLEQLRTPESRAFLQPLAEGDSEARLTQEARA